MLLKAYNKALITDREKTFLTTAAAAADTSLTVASTDLAPAATSSDTWADNDYMLIGDFGEEGTEIMQVAAAVTSVSAITIDRSGSAGGCRNAHPVGTPVYRLGYNRVEFSNSATDSTSGVSVLTTIRVQPDDLFTRYEDTANTTGYGFIRFNNETSGAFSSYSDGVNYESDGTSSSRDPRTLWNMRKKVRKLLDENRENSKITDDDIDDALNDAQRDVAHQPLVWSFYEGERSFSAVANQFAYTIPATVHKPHGVTFGTQPLIKLNRTKWKMLHWDSSSTNSRSTHYHIWDGQFLFWERPSSAAASTTLGAAISSATATSITVAASSSFKRGDYFRLIIDSEVIYATASTSTTFTGCLRGREGTTAATHSNGATVTERDIVYGVQEEPTDLINTQDRTNIPEPDVLTYGAAIALAPLVGKEESIANFNAHFEFKTKQLKEKYAVKDTEMFGRVHDVSEFVNDATFPSLDPNLYPKDVNS